MPVQTNKKNVNLADGCRVSVKASESAQFLDLGVMEGDYVATLQYDEERKEWANAAPDITRSNFRMEGSFTLANLEFTGLEEISNGMIKRTATAGTPVTVFDNQVVDGFTPNVPVELVATVTATGKPIKFSAAPAITSIVDDGDPTTLTADDDYFVIPDANAASGYSIMFTDEGTGAIATTAGLTIEFGTNTPVTSETLTCGTSSFEAKPYAMRIQHFNSADVADYTLDLYNVYTSPGSYNFGLKGADTGGYDTMEISFSVELDETKTDGAQLFSVTKNV